jgi:hypothetical protein
MTYTTLTPSGFRVMLDGEIDFLTHYNYNISLLDSTLLKLHNLLDVNSTGIVNGSVLRWDVGTSKWVMWKPGKSPL